MAFTYGKYIKYLHNISNGHNDKGPIKVLDLALSRILNYFLIWWSKLILIHKICVN